MTKRTEGPEGDEQVQARKRALFKRRAAQHALVLDAQLSTPHGRRFVWWVLEELCEHAAGSYVPGAMEGQRQTDFREGKRDVAISIREALQWAQPDAFTAMEHEARQQIAQDRRELEQAETGAGPQADATESDE